MDQEFSPRLTVRSASLALSAVLLGLALQVTDGLFSPAGITILSLSFTVCIAAVLGPQRILDEKRVPLLFLAAVVVLELIPMPSAPLGALGALDSEVPILDRPILLVAVALAAGLVLLIAKTPPRIAKAAFAALILLHIALSLQIIRERPEPFIDVFVFHRESAAALKDGLNPYAITFTNIYEDNSYVYAPGLVRNGRLLFGYPYPPLTLVLMSTGEWILGDSRYATLAAILVTALLLVAICPNRMGMLTAALFLFMPRTFYIIERSWTEPLSLAFLVATALVAVRLPKLMPILFGLLIASKQYLPAAAALVPLLIGHPHIAWHESRRAMWGLTRFLLIAIGVAALVTLPLALWDIRSFWYSVVQLQMRQPYRQDALSYLAMWGLGRTGWQGPFWLAFVALGIAIGLSLWKGKRGPGGFVAAVALCFFAFFSFNKQAFANYYYLVFGALCCAVACQNCTPSGESADNTLSDYADDSLPHSARADRAQSPGSAG